MNWRQKAQIQNVIASLPLSDPVYYAMQRTMGSLKRGLINPLEWFSAAKRMAEWIEEAGQHAEGGRFLEVGTGRMISVPIGLWLCGAAETITVDLNKYLSSNLVLESCRYVREHPAAVIALFGKRSESSLFRDRLEQLVNFQGSLNDLLTLTNIRYLPFSDAGHLSLPDSSVDFHVSYAVFEHIPGEDLFRILVEARRVLAPNGLLIHTIDPSDHFSHDDQSITAINFLQFSENEWQRLAGNKFSFHNRLRRPHYLDLLKRARVHILREEQTVDEPSLTALRNGFPLDSLFSALSPEELSVRSVNVMGTFSNEQAENE